MTVPIGTPLAEQRRVRTLLRKTRDERGLTQKDVAEALDWSTSKLIRIENGSVGISVTDLKALLLHYGITGAAEVDRMVEGVRASKKAAWWQQYRSTSSAQFITFLGLEASAIRIRQYQALLFPGLLQTPGYAGVLTAIGTASEEEAHRNLEIRLKRQELIAENGPELFFIIDEAVLYRMIGDAGVMREQLQHIKEVSRHPNVTVQVMPFSAGVHKGMKGSFEIFELSDEPDDYALLLDQPYQDELFPDPSEETKEFVGIFFELEKLALPAQETERILDARIAELR